ncbi:MAG TPA: UvrD-helicase domain-containing protein [Pirellulales bacterium]|nr:UvrD-helicase domain-containing protein [Pirellulales bacterium]
MTERDKPFGHIMIRASAGTGKTFQLSNRYLGLASRGAAVEEILASTFTRKAAGEILDRVLLRLAAAAVDPAECAELAEFIGDASLDRPRALELLESLVRRLHRLRISTLDSFFAQIATSFSLELGLPPGWRIVESSADDRLRSEAIRAVLAEGDARTVLALLHLLTKGEATRSVSDQIRDLVDGLHGLYLETPAEAWQRLPRPPRLSGAELAAALAALAEAPLPADKRCATAREGDLERATLGRWADFIEKGMAAKVAVGETTYYKKPLDEGLIEAYRQLLRHAQAVLVGQLADQTEATRRLLEQFDAHYQRFKLARRVLRFDDVTRKLASAAVAGQSSRHAPRAVTGAAVERHHMVGDGSRSEPATIEHWSYRLDSQLSHLLLDEFQDTSLLQWNVVRPFAARVFKAASGSFFCVGDVKQAIYGWRGGNSELFDTLEAEWSELAQESLSRSFRSAPAVIETVNRVFARIAGAPMLDAFPAAVAAWSRGFAEHSTEHDRLPGYVRLLVAPGAGDEQDKKTATLEFAAAEIARLAGEAPNRSVGALVRDNKAVARLIYELRRRGIQASEEGGNPLTDSPAVAAVLSLLTLADHPGDTVARFHVAQSPLGPIVGLKSHQDEFAAGRLSLSVRRKLINDGYGTTIYRWCRELSAHCDARDARRLTQLVELAYRYEPESTLRVRDFVNYVESQKVEDPTAAQVRVMTIHQSKGLEFDIVVLPQLDVNLRGQPPAVVVGRPEAAAAPNFVCRYAGEKLRALLPREVQQVFASQVDQAIRESLCVLYVALTRAAHALHMIVAPPDEREKNLPATFAGLLRFALADGRKAEAGQTLYELGRADWHGGASSNGAGRPPDGDARGDAEGEASSEFRIALAPAGERRSRGLERQSPSGLEGGDIVDLAKLMRLDAAGALERGTVVHAWFEQIEWLDDEIPQDPALLETAMKLGASSSDAAHWLAEFRTALARAAVRDCLLRSAYLQTAPWTSDREVAAELAGQTPKLQVARERRFAVRERDAILSGSLDRLVLIHRGDKLVAAEVLDFKTDRVSPDRPEQLAAAIDAYRPQLNAYRQAVSRMTGLPLDRIFARLLFVEPGLLQTIGPSESSQLT